MLRDITITFDDGSTHVYKNVPDSITPETVQKRAEAQFGKSVTDINGGRKSDPVGADNTPPMTQEQIDAHRKASAKSLIRGNRSDFQNMVGDIVSGAAGLGAKVLDIPSRLLDAPWLRSEMGQAQDVADKDSLAYLGGSFADPISNAIGSGSFTAAARMAPKLNPILQGMFGGAMAGGAIGGAQSESLEGAGTGVALGAALPLGFATLKGGYNMAAPVFSKKAAELGAARELTAIAGDDAKRLARILSGGDRMKYSPLETMSQTANPIQNPKIAALEKVWQSKYGSVDAYRNKAAQEALEETRIAFLGAETAPQRQAAIDKANEITRAFRVAGQKGQMYADDAAAQVDKVRRMESLGQDPNMQIRTDASSQATSIQSGNPRVGGRSTSRAQELMTVAESASEQAAKQSLVSGASARLADNIAGSMASRGLKPLSATDFISSIARVRNAPENVTNDSLRLVSQKLINAVGRAANANNGVLDAKSLDTLRRTAINDYIEAASRGNPSQAKKLASNEVTQSFKKAIDEMIEGAGGKGYVDYMQKYSSARAKIERPLERMTESDEMAKAGMREVLEILNSEKVHGSGLLERSVTIAQAVARAAKGIGGKNVGKAGAELTQPQNTQKLGRLMNQYMNTPKWMYAPYATGGMLNAGFGATQEESQ